MPIVVTCSNCQRSFRVADEFAGRSAKCGGCQARIQIPKLAAVSTRPVAAAAPIRSGEGAATGPFPADDPQELAKRIAAEFRGAPGRPPVSAGYRAMLAVGTIGLALVPIGYCLTIAGAILLLIGLSNVARFGFLLRIQIPLAIGLATAVVFMLRAVLLLFIRRKPVPESPRFDIDGFPALAGLLREISQRIGTPMPDKLEFHCQPNAAASFGDSLWRQMFSRELVLHVGLPLAGGRTVGQFAEILAHELGHFSQPSAIRLTILHRWIGRWMAAAATQPSNLSPERAEDAELFFVRLFYLAMAGGVAAARGILMGLYNLACLVCAGVLRQLEYDADRCSAAIVGLRTFTQNEYWLHEMQRGFREACKLAGESLSRNTLPDDLPDLALAWLDQWNEEQRAAMRERLSRASTGWLDTHPASPDRIEAVRRTGAKGVFHCDLPARLLIPNYDGLCRAATRGFYYNQMGSPPDAIVFAPPAELFPYWEAYARRRR